MGLWYGVAPYHEAGQGPLNDWVYPPMALLAYLPATLAPDPAIATLAGRCLSLLLVLGPSIWLLMRGSRGLGLDPVARLGLVSLLLVLVARSRSLTYVATEVVADAPALALAMVGLGLIGARDERARLGAATCGILAVWCKQIALGLGLAVVLAGLSGRPWRSWPVWLVRVAIVSMFLLAGFALAFGLRAVWFQIWVLPGGHPLRVRSWRAVPDALAPIVLDAHGAHLTIAAAGLVAWLLLRRRVPAPVPPDPASPRPSPGLLIAAGCVAFPLAAISYLKLGGDDNSLSHVFLPITMGGTLGLGWVVARLPRAGLAGLVVLNLVLAWPMVDWVRTTWDRGQPSWSDDLAPGRSWIEESRRVSAALRDDPGTLYFPLFPLEHLMARGAPVHFEEGLYDLALASVPISADHLKAFLPRQLRWVIYPGGRSFTSFEARRRVGFSDQAAPFATDPTWAAFGPVAR
jgi:hypothetical protein